MRLGTVPGNDWFHEPSIEILQRVAWGTPEAGGALSQVRTDERQPNIEISRAGDVLDSKKQSKK
jgi:hypothetical protein